ncbi:MAG: hypothetical protein K2L97_00750 [Muribaculaceae bacterium]|nr:hypothetical protein [Muribaculaceae bacterium]
MNHKLLIRIISLCTLPAGVALMIASCSGDKSSSPASELYQQAADAYASANYTLATELLDSLQRAYPAEIAIQREGMALRPQVIEKATLLKISTNDSLMTLSKVEADKLKPRLKWIKTPQMPEGHWVAAEGYNPAFMSSTGIQGRVSEIGEFYIVSSANPAISHTSVSLSGAGASAQTPSVPYDGESNYRVDGGEIITFSPAQSDTIGHLAALHHDAPLTLTLRGKSNRQIKLTPAQIAALSDTYAYALAVQQARRLAVERQRLEATLQVARDQMARTAALSESPETETAK